jgi:dTDP-glucose 4,6-dehydratase
MGMRLLVTGGAGFIGSHFVKLQMNNSKWESITVLDALTYAGNKINLEKVFGNKKFSFFHGDICDEAIVNKLTGEADVIVNFAAESHVDRSLQNSSEFIRTNTLGTNNLLHYALSNGVEIFHQVSTDEVYGSIVSGSWDENYPLLPNSPYSASKASADLVALSYYKSFGLDVRISRCSNNYGPYQFPEKLISLSITNLLQSKKIPVYGNGLNRRDWLHVKDHCRAIELILNHGEPGEVYNIGGGSEMSNLEVVDLIIDIMGLDSSCIKYVDDRKGHDFRYSVNWKKLADLTGYKPLVSFPEGIREAIDWYRNNPHWWMPLIQSI